MNRLSGKLTDSILKAVQKYAKKKRKNVRELLKGVLKRYEGGSLQGVISPSDFKDALETVGCGKIVTETQSDALASFFDVDGDNMVDCASFVAFMCLRHIDAAAGALLNKIRIYIRERNATETYGLFDDSKSLKGRLKSLYKSKSAKTSND